MTPRTVITDDDLFPVPHQGGVPAPPVGPLAEPPQPWQAFDPAASPAAAKSAGGHRALLITGVTIGVTLAAVAGFLGGRASRPSDDEIAKARQQSATVATEKARIQTDAEIKKVRAEERRKKDQAVARAANKARAEGRDAGLSQGRAEGTADGTARGRDIGREEGLSTNLCYDAGSTAAC